MNNAEFYLVDNLEEVVRFFQQREDSRKGKRKRAMKRFKNLVSSAQLRIEELEDKVNRAKGVHYGC